MSADDPRRKALLDVVHNAQVSAAFSTELAGKALAAMMMPVTLEQLPDALAKAQQANERLDGAMKALAQVLLAPTTENIDVKH